MPQTSWKKIRAEELEEGRLLRLVLDAGKGNVLDSAAIAELREALAELASRPGLRAILLDHEGKHFSFGASVEEHLPETVGEMLAALHALARELLAPNVPLMVAVRGACLGGGLEVAALGDLVFASADARFGQPEINLGVFAPMGSVLLPRLVGSSLAADLLLSGRALEASEAAEAGLVAQVAEDPSEAARAWFREHLVGKSALALRFATRAARLAWVPAFLTRLEEVERLYLQELMAARDPVEGLRAFLEKRPPAWTDS